MLAAEEGRGNEAEGKNRPGEVRAELSEAPWSKGALPFLPLLAGTAAPSPALMSISSRNCLYLKAGYNQIHSVRCRSVCTRKEKPFWFSIALA